MRPCQNIEKRFFAKVDRSGGPDSCWDWTASLFRSGYGQFGVGRKVVSAHRFAWSFANGEIPEEMCVCHTCDNRRCCNVAHLFLGTHADNMADKNAKGRGNNAKGEEHGNSKLTEADAREIVAEADKGVRGTVLARKFGVGKSAVYQVLRGDTWSHLTGIQQAA